jgi:hypothetical protein
VRCGRVEVREDGEGAIRDVGRRRRTIPTLLRRALHLRDRGCLFPGCTNRWVDGHHVVPWSRGGPTILANLCSLCRRHHTFVHDRGIRIVPEANSFRFVRASGTVIEPSGVPPLLPPRPIEALRARTEAEGIMIDSGASASTWGGKPVDYDHIDFALMARHQLEGWP